MDILRSNSPDSNLKRPMEIMVPLTRGFYTTIDVQDVELADLKWCAVKGKTGAYAMRADKNREKIWLHRAIMERIVGRKLLPEEIVDHIDRDSLNNRRDNLRIATYTQNIHNRQRPRNNTSGYKGVHSSGNAWIAKINAHGQFIYLGRFPDAVSAANAYNNAAIQYHGEYAVLNRLPEER